MENLFRNEMEIELGGEKILLRPTFENMSAMESKLGGLTYIAWKFSKSAYQVGSSISAKDLPSMTDIAQIIYFNQAATKPDDHTKKQFSLEEIWSLVQAEGISVIRPVTLFLSRMTAGNKMAVELSENQKKS